MADYKAVKLMHCGNEYCFPKGNVVPRVDFLLIGGGGAGSGVSCTKTYGYGGGGGAGGYIECFWYPVEIGCAYPIVIGSGGSGGYNAQGSNGGNSCFGTIVAYGGGAGGKDDASGCPGGSGGGGGRSGDGSCCTTVSSRGGAGCQGQGNNGGFSVQYRYQSGGGGGAGGDGGRSGANSGRTGGVGRQSCMTGALVRYAGGGGGGQVAGGCGCSGCGGGGGPAGKNATSGGGKCGIFVARYHTDGSDNITCATGGCVYTCGDYTIHCFTSSGTFTIVS